jgi:glycosyltransferase involved in cell wall biosynthesis
MKLVAILRIKNEIEIIDESLASLSQLADEIIIVDNGSTDGTELAYAKYPKVVSVLKTEGFNEGRDKIMLLAEAKKRKPDWIMFLDADEIFEKNFTRAVVEKYMHSSYDMIEFRLCHFWLDKVHCRLFDRYYFLYSVQPIRSMWRNQEPTYYLDKVIHNLNIQGDFKNKYFSPYRIKHFSLIDRIKILDKIKLYQEVDQGERDYRHMHPDEKYFTYRFLEFNSHIINYLYILLNKWFLHLLWSVVVVWLRVNKNSKIKK